MDISGDKTFYTVTMARVYADQGRFEEAVRIYRYLLDQTPDRSDLRQALEAATAMLPDIPGQWHDISDLIERWVRLLLRQNTYWRLKKTRVPSVDDGV
ncbi:MAG: tetratricopeptide repeat-containing protein [Deltaproteobacteria bacterium]|nr:tetratricopeptide repeat-containing protein [Deltaproteobacteria bacterium]